MSDGGDAKKDVAIQIRVSKAEAQTLNRLVAERQAELGEEAKVSQGSFLRQLLDERARLGARAAAPPPPVDWDKTPLPRPWRHGDPEPPRPDLFVHLHDPENPDPWSTICGKRAPLARLSSGPGDCPGCLARFEEPAGPETRQEGPQGAGAPHVGTDPVRREAWLTDVIAQERLALAAAEARGTEDGRLEARVLRETIARHEAELEAEMAMAAPHEFEEPLPDRIIEYDNKPAAARPSPRQPRPYSIHNPADLPPEQLKALTENRRRREDEARAKRSAR